MKAASFIFLAFLAVLPTRAAVVVFSQAVGVSIPDDTAAGLVREIAVTDAGIVNSLNLSLDLSAATGNSAFLGDLFIYLEHDSAISVLVNRPGRSTDASLGYDDNQSLTVTLSDSGSGNIHNYRSVLFGRGLPAGVIHVAMTPSDRSAPPGGQAGSMPVKQSDSAAGLPP